MTESDGFQEIKRSLTEFLGRKEVHLTRHEDECTPGIPDVSYGLWGVNGWIELKAYTKWPVRIDKVKFSNLKPEQKNWIRNRYQAGGKVFLGVFFGKELVLIPGCFIDEVKGITVERLLEVACYRERFPLSGRRLAEILSQG